MKSLLVVVALLAVHVSADIYLHMPRGSNNRLDDENRDRNNANRLYDSQNNNRGGYNVGSTYYYVGSKVTVEWSAQHSCGQANNNCELIFQYTCDDLIRDGTTTNTIPDDPNDCYNWDCDTDVEYGRHESYDWYQQCKYRERNMGLFTSSQDLQGNDARFTRQNPNGARRGYECPEERDYYPYWYPTMWKDVAVFTNQPGRCAAYQEASENVVGRYYCQAPELLEYNMRNNRAWLPITQAGCEAIMPTTDETTNITETTQWVMSPSHGLDAPLCNENMWSRDNHHGNVRGGSWANFNWTVPNTPHEQCVFRLRYNISTGDYEEWLTLEDGTMTVSNNEVDYMMNHDQPGNNRFPAHVDIWTQYGLTMDDVADCFDATLNGNDDTKEGCREYVIVNNPKVDIFGALTDYGQTDPQLKFQLAVNTAQYGRTFQDRTHTFAIRPMPSGIDDTVHNLQVRGKRGNIVQNYPGTEYDFSPVRLNVQRGTFIHFQWTGSNTNPNNNAGQGRQGSDRHNAVLLRSANYFEEGMVVDENGMIWQDTNPTTHGHWGNSYPANIEETSFAGFSYDAKMMLALNGFAPGLGYQFGGEMSELDDSGTYFDSGPLRTEENGIYHYLCTRNNNFSNRDQKAKIVVSDSVEVSELVGTLGGTIRGSTVTISFGANALSGLTSITVTESPKTTKSSLEGVSSNFIAISPDDLGGAKFTAKLEYDNDPLGSNAVYHSFDFFGTWAQISNAEFSTDRATFTASEGGLYAVATVVNYGAVIGIAIAVCVVLGVGLFVGFRWYRNKNASANSTARSINAVA